MAKKDLLDLIDVPEPCPQSWEAMKGDDKSRFCGSCEKDIYNLSEMTRREAKKLILQSKESVCVRLEKDTHGKVKTLKKQLHQITRQVPIAAGVLSASLALAASADAQRKPPPIPRPPVGRIVINKDILDMKSKASISGTITDSTGAVIPGAEISLFDAKNKLVKKITSNIEGFYEFKLIKAGIYNLEIETPGYKKFVQSKIEVKADEEKELKFELDADEMSETIGVLSAFEFLEIESSETKISDTIETKPLESLPPAKSKNFLGLAAPSKATKNKQTVRKKSKQ